MKYIKIKVRKCRLCNNLVPINVMDCLGCLTNDQKEFEKHQKPQTLSRTALRRLLLSGLHKPMLMSKKKWKMQKEEMLVKQEIACKRVIQEQYFNILNKTLKDKK